MRTCSGHHEGSMDGGVRVKPLNMVIDRRKVILFTSAAALRLVLFFAFPSLPVLLTGRVEISTPVTSFKRCKTSGQSHYAPLMTDVSQYKKACSSTPTMSPHTMAVSSIR